MTYEQYKQEILKLEKRLKIAQENLSLVCGETNGKLLSDEIKESIEYKLAKYAFYNVFGEFQKFNSLHAKSFSRMLIAEKRAKK